MFNHSRGGYKANIKQPPRRGQPPKRGQKCRSQSVLSSEVLLYNATTGLTVLDVESFCTTNGANNTRVLTITGSTTWCSSISPISVPTYLFFGLLWWCISTKPSYWCGTLSKIHTHMDPGKCLCKLFILLCLWHTSVMGHTANIWIVAL